MRVTVAIDVWWGDGQAVPVRALPFVSPCSLDPLSPYRIASDLAQPFDGPFEHEPPDVNPRVLTGLSAYHLDESRKPAKILPGEWDRIVRAIEEAPATERAQIECLPAGVFVWRRAFEDALDGYKQGVRAVTYDPVIPQDIAPLVIEGFAPDSVAEANPMPAAVPNDIRSFASVASCALHVLIVIESREAIPVRAIPFATGWTLSPDRVAKDLAGCSVLEKLREPHAYHLGPSGAVRPMLPKEWDVIVADLNALSAELDEAGISGEERYPIWRRRSIRHLSAGTFLWRDEFEGAFSRGYSKYRWEIFEEREGDRGWTYDPLVPEDQQGDVLAGFETCLGSGADRPPAAAPAAAPVAVAKAPSDKLDTTGMVAWQAVTLDCWDAIVAAHGPAPPHRKVLGWLRKNGPRDVFPEDQPQARDTATWLDGEGNRHTLKLSNLTNRIGEWRQEGWIPPLRK